jgi:hypothetical protein
MSRPELQEHLSLFVPPISAVSSQWWRCVMMELRELIKAGALVQSYDGVMRQARFSVVFSNDILEV